MSNLKEDEIDLITKRRIIAYLGSYKEVVKIVKAKLYTTDQAADHWLDSGLEGYLCFVTDSETKTRYFIMYSYNNYEKLFEMELYNNFKDYYTQLTDYFHCFEFCEGFIGFQFFNIEAAKMFKTMVMKFDDKLLQMLMSGGSVKIDKREIVKRNIKIAKNKFTGNGKYDSDYIEEGLFINKPRYFELLGNITFDKETKKFIINEKETIELLKRAGISKNQMKDTAFALSVFKMMIETLEKDNANVNVDVKRVHNYPKNKLRESESKFIIFSFLYFEIFDY